MKSKDGGQLFKTAVLFLPWLWVTMPPSPIVKFPSAVLFLKMLNTNFKTKAQLALVPMIIYSILISGKIPVIRVTMPGLYPELQICSPCERNGLFK